VKRMNRAFVNPTREPRTLMIEYGKLHCIPWRPVIAFSCPVIVHSAVYLIDLTSASVIGTAITMQGERLNFRGEVVF
jgi:hypothetical protein